MTTTNLIPTCPCGCGGALKDTFLLADADAADAETWGYAWPTSESFDCAHAREANAKEVSAS